MESARCRAVRTQISNWIRTNILLILFLFLQLGRYAISNFLLHPVDSVIEVVKGVISSCTKFEPIVMQKLKHIQVPEMWTTMQ